MSQPKAVTAQRAKWRLSLGAIRQSPLATRRRRLLLEEMEGRRLLSSDVGTAISIYHEDFESGPGGFTVDNTGGAIDGLWHYSSGRRADLLPNHTPEHSFYYGLFETPTGDGRYDVLPFDHQGVLISPAIQLPPQGTTTLMFNYLLDTRPEINVDFVDVSVDDGTSVTPILSRANGTLPETSGMWRCQSADLSEFNGKTIRLRFSFDTVDAPRVDPEGWYVDDVWISNVPPTGRKFNDINADGLRDADGADNVAGNEDDEAGLSGWVIRAYKDLDNDGVLDAADIANGVVSSDISDSDGIYTLSLAAGNYILVELKQPGWLQSAPGTLVNSADPSLGMFGHAVTVSDGAPLTGQDFGNFRPDISGYKWDDQDADGVWDTGEPGLNGWAVYLDLDGSGTSNNRPDGTPEPSFVTRNDGMRDGAFWFAGLAPGAYTVRELPQDGWKQSYPGAPNFEHAVTIDPANGVRVNGRFEQTEPANFGNFRPDISGYKWDDRDADGIWDAGEPGLNDWTVYLDENNNDVPDAGEPSFTTQNDGMHDGAFWFKGLAAGAYTVREVLQDDWTQSYPGSPEFEHVVTIDPPGGVRVNGRFERTEPPNFGNRLAQADLTLISKVDVPDPVVAGSEITYVISYANLGLAPAQGVMIRDLIPANTSYKSGSARVVTGTDWMIQTESSNGDIVAVKFLKNVSPTNDTATFELVVTVNAATAGGSTIDNVATVNRNSPHDPNTTNDSASATTAVVAPPCTGTVSGTKWLDQDGDGVRDLPQDVGLADWTILVYRDDSPQNGQLDAAERAAGAVIGGLTLANGSYSFTLPCGNYIVLETLRPPGQTTGDFAVQTAPLTQVIPDPVDAGPLGRFGHAFTLSAAEPTRTGLDFGNRAFSADVELVSKVDVPDPVPAGADVTYTISYRNSGRDAANNVVVRDVIPTNTTYKSASVTEGTGWSGPFLETNSTGRVLAVRFEKSTSASADVAMFQLVVAVDATATDGSTISNTATVSSATPADPNAANNSATSETTVTTSPNPTTNIDGIKFQDTNGDGIRQSAEPPLAGWEIRVYADTNRDGRLQPNESASPFLPPVFTDLNGAYSIRNLPDGNYIVVEVLQAGWRQTFPSTPVLDGNVTVGSAVLAPNGYAVSADRIDADFGNQFLGITKRRFLSSSFSNPASAGTAGLAAPGNTRAATIGSGDPSAAVVGGPFIPLSPWQIDAAFAQTVEAAAPRAVTAFPTELRPAIMGRRFLASQWRR